MKAVQSPKKPQNTHTDDTKRITDQLMEKLEIDEAEASQLLLNSMFQHTSPKNALDAFKTRFPHLPTPELTVAEQAMQLVSEAEEAHDSGQTKQAKALLKKALKQDPNCADAYLLEVKMLPRYGPFTEAYTLLQKALSAGKASIDSQGDFDANVGEFWSWTVTRPYMRALETMAQACWEEPDHRDEAIGHAFEMLRLNPNDNQGIRQPLLYWLMSKDRWDEAYRLWKQYEKGYDAWWIYGRSFLSAYRNGAQSASAKKQFEEALTYNPFVAMILLMAESEFMHGMMQDYYCPGDPSEAAYMVNDLVSAQGVCMPEESTDTDESLPTMMRLFFEMLEHVGPRKIDKLMRKATQQLISSLEA